MFTFKGLLLTLYTSQHFFHIFTLMSEASPHSIPNKYNHLKQKCQLTGSIQPLGYPDSVIPAIDFERKMPSHGWHSNFSQSIVVTDKELKDFSIFLVVKCGQQKDQSLHGPYGAAPLEVRHLNEVKENVYSRTEELIDVVESFFEWFPSSSNGLTTQKCQVDCDIVPNTVFYSTIPTIYFKMAIPPAMKDKVTPFSIYSTQFPKRNETLANNTNNNNNNDESNVNKLDCTISCGNYESRSMKNLIKKTQAELNKQEDDHNGTKSVEFAREISDWLRNDILYHGH